MSKKADVLQQKSPAEFFAENKNIAGFDNVCPITVICLTHKGPMQVLVCNQQMVLHCLTRGKCDLQPGKCLYTTVRELVENSLDAAESGGRLPEIEITM